MLTRSAAAAAAEVSRSPDLPACKYSCYALLLHIEYIHHIECCSVRVLGSLILEAERLPCFQKKKKIWPFYSFERPAKERKSVDEKKALIRKQCEI